jgi:hypothetical protein
MQSLISVIALNPIVTDICDWLQLTMFDISLAHVTGL